MAYVDVCTLNKRIILILQELKKIQEEIDNIEVGTDSEDVGDLAARLTNNLNF